MLLSLLTPSWGQDCIDGVEVELCGECYNIETTTSINPTSHVCSGFEIPPEIGNLVNLTALWLGSTGIGGEIPSEIGNLTNLEILRLNSNQLTGEIPPEIGNLTNLTSLLLHSNELTGEIPAEIGNLTNLTHLDFQDNQLTGEMPAEIGNLTNLTNLNLYTNELTGSIPSEIGNLNNLGILDLGSNQLTGEIPPEIGNLTNLYDLYLDSNQLTGSIPSEIGNLVNLWKFYLNSNQLTGWIPSNICNLNISNWSPEWIDWSYSYMFNNQFCPPYPECIEDYVGYQNTSECVEGVLGCTDPEAFNYDETANVDDGSCCNTSECVEDVVLGCTYPEAFNYDETANVDDGSCCVELWGECYNIETTTSLDLYSSGLTGEIPSSIGNLTNLIYLDLTDNQLIGEIPSEIGQLTNLDVLGLGYNQLTGNIPIEIWNLTNLTWLFLGHNQLSGDIPPEIGNLVNLTHLEFWDNQFSGEVPAVIWTMVNLTYLDLFGNQLSGEIPPEIGNLVNLTALWLGDNQFFGEIPLEIGNLINLQVLDISYNQLSGEIPDSICNLININWSSNWIDWSYSYMLDNQLCTPFPDCLSEEVIGYQDAAECPEDYCLELHSGKNLKSFHALPEDVSISNIMSSVAGNATGVIGQGVATSYSETLGWIGSLSTLSYDSGYWMTVVEPDSLCLSGAVPCDSNICLEEGPNLVSFPSPDCFEISDAFPDDIEDNISGIIGEGVSATNNPNLGWKGSLLSLCGTEGYWMIADTDFCFSYDLSTLSRINTALAPEKLDGCEFAQSTEQAFYFIESIENIEQGDIIHTYDNGINVGSRVWNGSFTDVPAMGDDGSKFTAGYCTAGSIPTFKVEKANGSLITLTGDIPEWSNNQLYMIGYLEESIALPAVYSLSTAYPNPFNPTTTLSFAIPIDSEVSLSVYNLQGREVSTLINGNMDAGYHSIVWDANSYASGVYFVKLVAGEFVNTQKLMLIK